jgi:hypothetical protein
VAIALGYVPEVEVALLDQLDSIRAVLATLSK